MKQSFIQDVSFSSDCSKSKQFKMFHSNKPSMKILDIEANEVKWKKRANLDYPFYPPGATSMNNNLAIIGMQLNDLLPHFLDRNVMVRR